MSDISRTITMRNSRNMAWPRRASESVVKIKAEDMMPNFKVTAEALTQLWDLAAAGGSLALRAQKYTSHHLLSVKLVPCKHKADFLVPVRTQQLSPRQADSVWRGVFAALDDFDNLQVLEPLSIFRPNLQIEKQGRRLRIEVTLTHPTASFDFHRLESFKLVSTPLSQELLCSSSSRAKFRCGYVTLDSSKRALPLLNTDPTSIRYPLVGIWVANIPSDFEGSHMLTHPSVWAACVRYLHTSLIQERVSPDPASQTFLIVHFHYKAKYYEVNARHAETWRITKLDAEATQQEDYFSPVFFNFAKDSDMNALSLNRSLSYNEKTLSDSKLQRQSSFSSSCGLGCSAYSRTSSESFSSSHSSNSEIYDHSRTIRLLELQLKDMQAQVESHKVSSGTNTSFVGKTLREAQTNTTITSFQEAVPDSAYDPRKYSPPKTGDVYEVPRIIFEPESDSSDDDSAVEKLQLKYLRV